jgi:hypothetical protein
VFCGLSKVSEADGMISARPSERSASIRSTFTRFGVVFIVLLVVLPVVFEMVFPSAVFETLWVEATKAKHLERAFGFTAETRSIPVAGADRQTLPVITQVTAGGRMAQAGARAGDVVVCLPRGRLGFWNELIAADGGYQATLHVASPEQVGRGCAAARAVQFPGKPRPREM